MKVRELRSRRPDSRVSGKAAAAHINEIISRCTNPDLSLTYADFEKLEAALNMLTSSM